MGLRRVHVSMTVSSSHATTKIENIKVNDDSFFYIKQFRKKKRSLHETHPRRFHKNKNINAVRNNKNVPYRNGFYMNDMVMCNGKIGWVYGFGGGKNGKNCIIRDINGDIIKTSNMSERNVNVAMKDLKFICHNNNWQYSII